MVHDRVICAQTVRIRNYFTRGSHCDLFRTLLRLVENERKERSAEGLDEIKALREGFDPQAEKRHLPT